jgi:small subunit ribosomal protein S20
MSSRRRPRPAPKALTNHPEIRIVARLNPQVQYFGRPVLANTAQAKKRARQAEAHRTRNVAQRSLLRSRIKGVRTAIAAKDKAAAQSAFREAAATIDRMAGKGILHKNAAARYKSALNQRLRAL